MKYRYILSLILLAAGASVFVACEDEIEPISELHFTRVLSPIGLEAFIRNQTTIELNWKLREGVDTYVVEFSEDSLQFENIILTDEVTSDELPYRATFAGETRYSARVKALGADGLDESKWSTITIATAPENIYLPLPGENIEDTYVTVLWAPGSEVTHFVIAPGNIERPITGDEKAAGEATITGLTSATAYTVTLYNGTKRRGTVAFTTIREADLFPDDDLSAAIASAPAGAELMLAPGVYTFTGTLTIDKSIILSGQKPHDKPVLNVDFQIVDGAGDVIVRNVELNGDGYNTVFNLGTAGVEYGSIKLESCVVYDYGRQLIYGNVASKLGTFAVDDCIIRDFELGGGDFIDFRPAYVANVTLTNSTFSRCPTARDFIRLDAAGSYTGTGLTTNVLVEHCTIYGVSNTADRLFYVRFDANVLTLKNTLIVETDAIFTNNAATSQPICQNNNYFNAPGFTKEDIENGKYDNSGTHTTRDPGFVDPDNGDFTITDQVLIDKQIGDPRWRQ